MRLDAYRPAVAVTAGPIILSEDNLMHPLRTSAIAAAVLAVLALGPGGCPPRTGNVDNTLSELLVQFFDDSSSNFATISDQSGAMALTIQGDPSAASDMTGLYGTTSGGDSFSATFSNGVPMTLTTPSLSVQFTQLDESNYDADVTLTQATKRTATARRLGLSPGLYRSAVILSHEAYRCEVVECPQSVISKLNVLETIANLQVVLDTFFNEGCLESDLYGPSACIELLGVVDTLGRAIEGVINDDPQVYNRVGNLCFTVDPACDALVYAPAASADQFGSTSGSAAGGSGNDNTGDTTGDDNVEDPVAPTLTISGPDEVGVGKTWTFRGSSSPSDVDLTWDLLGGGATLNNTSGGTTTVTGVSAGTVSLVLEARDPDFGNVLATQTHTISIVPGPEYVVWYDTEKNCWDAPGLKVSTRDTYESTVAEGEKVVLQGGFSTSDEAWSWVCDSIQSKFRHAWCGFHYNIGGTYYGVSYGICDVNSIPTEN